MIANCIGGKEICDCGKPITKKMLNNEEISSPKCLLSAIFIHLVAINCFLPSRHF